MPSDDHLGRFLRRKDDAAFRELYRAHTPRLYGLAMRLTADSAIAEEIVQECWVRAVERLVSFDRRSSLPTWLCGILVNCYRENRRRRGRMVSLRSVPESADVVDFSTQNPPVDVERALALMADGYREVVVLHDIYGHTHREIAALLEISIGTSKSQLARGRSQLRSILRGERTPIEHLGGKTR